MEELLLEAFPGLLDTLELENDLKRATRLGFKPRGSVSRQELKDWLSRDAPPDENVIALFDTKGP
jgi:hypothetical protein